MPLDNLSEGARQHSATESSLSLLAISENNQATKLQTQDLITPLALGAGYAGLSTTSGILRDRVLGTLPDQRTGVAQWFEKNATVAHRELFAQQRDALVTASARLTRAEVFHPVMHDAYVKTRDALNSHAVATKHRLGFYEKASGQALQGQASSMILAARSGADTAYSATVKAVLRPGLHLAELETVGALWSYRRLLAEGKYHSPQAELCREKIMRGASALEGQGIRATEKAAEELALKEQHNVLTQFAKGPMPTREAVLATVGTAGEVGRGEKLFVSSSSTGRALVNFAAKVEAATKTGVELTAARTALTAEHERTISRLGGNTDGVASTLGRKFLAGVGLATLSTSGGYAFDHALSKQLGVEISDSDQSNRARIAVDGCLVPAFLLSELPMKLRVPLAVTAFGAGRASTFISADNILSPRVAELLKPNHVDTVLMGMSIMAPVSGRYKAIAMTGSLAAGRIANLF